MENNQGPLQLKTCKKCGATTNAYLKVCPSCKKKQSKNPLLFIIGGIVLFLLLIAIATSGKDTTKTTNSNKASQDDKKESKKEDSSQNQGKDENKDEKANTEKSLYKLGESAELNDVKITMQSVKESKGNSYAKPGKSKKFVYVKVKIENNSEDDISVSSMLSFDAYCKNYKLEYSSSALLAMAVNKNMQGLDGTVASGKKLSGYLGFEVPKTWKTIELHYTDNVWIGKKIKFLIEK